MNKQIDIELQHKQNIVELLTSRCNNCYSILPGPVGCSVNSPGWNWLTPNFGPFCDDCFKETKNLPIENIKKIIKQYRLMVGNSPLGDSVRDICDEIEKELNK